MTDFLDEKRREITDRLNELKPLIDEYQRLEAAAAALDGVGGSSSTSASARPAVRRRGPGRPRGSATKTAAAPAARKAAATPARRAGRRRGSGARAIQTLALVQETPGIKIPELAAKLGIKSNYLYRVLPGLEREGTVTQRDGGWHPKGVVVAEAADVLSA